MKDFKSKHIKRCEKILKYFNNPKFIRNYSFILGSKLFKEFDRASKLFLININSQDIYELKTLYKFLIYKYYNTRHKDIKYLLDQVNNDLESFGLESINPEDIYLMVKFAILPREFELTVYPEYLQVPLYDFTQDLTDKTLLYLLSCYGYGDCIWDFYFYKKYFSSNEDKIIFISPKPLYRITKKIFPKAEVLAFPDNSNIKKSFEESDKFFFSKLHFDYVSSRIFKDLGFKINHCNKLLNINADEITNYRKNLKNKFNIGIIYTSDTASKKLSSRNTKLEYFEPLTKIEEIQLYSLQYGKSDDIFKDYNIINLGKEFSDFYDTAVAIEAMDLIITTDTVTMHLAGALEKKTFVVLNKPSILGTKEIKQYKSIKIFQNNKTDNWAKTMKKVEKEVKKMIKSKYERF